MFEYSSTLKVHERVCPNEMHQIIWEWYVVFWDSTAENQDFFCLKETRKRYSKFGTSRGNNTNPKMLSKLNRRIQVSYKENRMHLNFHIRNLKGYSLPTSACNIVNASPTYGTDSSGTNSVTWSTSTAVLKGLCITGPFPFTMSNGIFIPGRGVRMSENNITCQKWSGNWSQQHIEFNSTTWSSS